MKNRGLISISIIGLAGVILFSGCSSVNKSELQKQKVIQELKLAGLPTTIDELVPPAIPDSENGALLYREAFKIKDSLGQKYKAEWDLINKPAEYDKASAEDKKRVSDVIFNDPDFSKFYQLLEKASRMKCQFLTKKDYQDGIAMLTPHLFSIKNCSGILATKAKVEAESGLIDKALSSCLTSLKMARYSEDQETLISQLVRMAMDITALDSLNYVIDYGNTNPELYSSLINQMESERKSKKVQPALKAELVFFIDLFERSGKESSNKPKKITPEEMPVSLPPDLAATFKKVSKINPKTFWADQTVTYCEVLSEEIPISGKPYFEGANKFQDLEKKVEKLPASKAIMTQLLTSGLFKAYTQEAKINAYLGVAEIGLANRLYKNKYNKFADSLDQVSPEFLATLPKDPFTEKDFIYRKQGNTFAIYSIGEDLKDDGGQERGIKKDIVWIDKGI